MSDASLALVTGGNCGIGLEVCRQLAALGWTVVLGSRDEARGADAAAGIDAGPGRVLPRALDVADAASVVWAATLPDDGPSGGFFRDGRPVPW